MVTRKNLWLLSSRQGFESRVGVVVVVVVVVVVTPSFDLFYGEEVVHGIFGGNPINLSCWRLQKRSAEFLVRYKARVAERQDTMQLQVVASQLRSFVLMNAAKDVWEALMKGIKPWFTVWVTLMVGKISTISVFEFEEWYIYLISLLLGCDYSYLPNITVHCRSEKYGVFMLFFEGPLWFIFRYHCQWGIHRICSLNLWAGPRCWTYLVGSFFQHCAGAGRG